MNKDRESVIIVRKKKGHGHGHHGGAWKVAFADFMTAMFALFLVLWLVNQSSDVKAAVAGYFQHPMGTADHFGSSPVDFEGAQMIKPPARADQQIIQVEKDKKQQEQQQSLAELSERIKDQLLSTPEFVKLKEHIELKLTKEGLQIQLLEDSVSVFFESGSPKPRPAAEEFLRVLGRELTSVTNRVVIEGHTDAVPYRGGTGYTNWELSADRANSARAILTTGGLPDPRIVQVRGHADRLLRDPAQPTAPSNRRVTITLLFEDGPAAAALPAAPPDSARS